MVDFVSKELRSKYMAAVKSRGNLSTEAKMVALLKAAHLKGWRRHCTLPGTPDFCWRKQKVALFVDGCFWHGCPKCYKPPKSNKAFWRKKVETNMLRDSRDNSELKKRGWKVLRVWECQIRSARSILRIEKALSLTIKS